MDSDYGALGAGIGILGWLLYMAVGVFYLFCMWKIYVKAGKPGWAAIVPVYNILVQLEIVGRPWWYLLLMFVPVVNIVIAIMIIFDLAKVFGKSTGFGFGLLFLSFIFIPILAFGDAQYQAPVVAVQ
ncbi:MAG: signal peptidase I [Anaerolineae bacterium]|nr:signal peptidase I [Anaerolineae bacterium]